ncbi:MAG: hypothetical protein EPO28_08950 [Saprospiraceae bacterium]|nr:MAG: hypothetical protein EPO28_08950 [Saprospiraceae bacterium]
MTTQHRNFWLTLTVLSIVGSSLYFGACTHDDQIVDEYIPKPTVNDKELLSKKVTAAPSIDGTIDAAWDDATKLETTATVPDPGQDVFKGYVGNSYHLTMRSMYDDQNIYFLAEWNDNEMSQNRDPWYFDPVAKLWQQESNKPKFDAAGQMTRPAFYEDKFAMNWNVNNTVAGWDQTTCYATCHTGLSATDGLARHYTSSASERVDMWHWKSVRNGLVYGQFDDQYMDNTTPNGRLNDSKVSGGYSDNVQTLTITGTATSVKVPKYFIPAKSYYYWITKEEIDNGTAKLITAVDADGVLTYDGGTVDPNADLTFQRNGATTGASGIPSVYLAPWVGSRGDITCAAEYTGSGWVLEFQRKLNTGDTEAQDVDFSTLEDKYFGVGIFNGAAIAHAIKPNLLLKFEK